MTPWLGEASVREHLESISDRVGIDLVTHGTTSDADTIRNTAIAQPLIVAAGVLTLRALFEGREALHSPTSGVLGVAGHSVGEVTAAIAAGILSEADAMMFVRERGNAMAHSASLAETGMSAVVGGDEAELLAALTELGLEPANFNGGGQIVVAGDLGALEALKAAPPAGARVIPLAVAGAFHTKYMAGATTALRSVAATLQPENPKCAIFTNKDGSRVSTGAAYLDLLIGQVSRPVRWDKTMESFHAAGVTGIIELAPAGALVGLAKRALKGLPTVAVKTPDDLAAALDLIDGK